MQDQVLLRVELAAERLGIGRSTLYQMIRRGEIESITIGSARRIPVEAINDYVQRLREEQAPAR